MATPTTKLYNDWITALKTGHYPKGREYLTRNGEYCCLGVACAVYTDIGHLNVSQLSEGAANYDDVTAYDNHVDVLPKIMVDVLRLQTNEGLFCLADLSPQLRDRVEQLGLGAFGIANLTAINDNTNSFDLIIEILEERPASLFA